MFKALFVEKNDGNYKCTLTTLNDDALPENDILIEVEYSTLNYKDALAITGKSPVVRNFPMVPGIDLAGTILSSKSSLYQQGDKVLVNGWGLGEQFWGGLAQKANVKSEWLVPLPESISTKKAMQIGTAGYTAMLCVLALEKQGITPEQGKILVTGANGGVGSVAIAILAKLGYEVVASTGRLAHADELKTLGASEIIDRNTLSEPGKPLMRETYAGVIDSVGSYTLANACALTKSEGAVAACGLAQGMDFPASVAPFILRGVKLLGINSVTQPLAVRQEAWQRLETDLDSELLNSFTQDIGLSDALDMAPQFLKGQVKGRIVVNVNA
jgi:acrylyl-CoA reductase (NADPH)